MIRRAGCVPVLVALALTLAGSAQAKILVVPPRAGQLGVGIAGQYGTMLSTGGLGEEFGSGAGLGVRLRYRLRYERAIGVSFEQQKFDVRHEADSTFAEKTLTLLNTSVEFYQLFGTRGRTTKMLSAGFGIVQPSKKLADGEVKLGGNDVLDGAFISVGAGIERFFYQSLGLDLNLHYQTIFQNGSTNHDIQAAAGLVFYASY
jgi:hypothetical protein